MFKKIVFLFLLLSVSGIGNAGLITQDVSFFRSVDRSTSSVSINVSSIATVVDVNASVGFRKCDGSALSNRTCTGTGSTYNSEIEFRLNHAGRTIALVDNHYSGQRHPSYSVARFDDEASTLVGGSPTSGTFRPRSSLSLFDGTSAGGSWTLSFTDTVGADPLGVYYFGLEILTNLAPTFTSFTPDLTVFTDELFTFNSVARDDDSSTGDTFNTTWDLDNDGQFDDWSGTSGQTSFATAGIFSVRARVSDSFGASDNQAFTVTVIDRPSTDVPEPSTIGLFGLALLAMRRLCRS